MPDWNGDGKLDWQDDYVINEIIPDKNDGGKSASCYGGCSTMLANLITAIISGIMIVIFFAIWFGIMGIIAKILF